MELGPPGSPPSGSPCNWPDRRTVHLLRSALSTLLLAEGHVSMVDGTHVTAGDSSGIRGTGNRLPPSAVAAPAYEVDRGSRSWTRGLLVSGWTTILTALEPPPSLPAVRGASWRDRPTSRSSPPAWCVTTAALTLWRRGTRKARLSLTRG